MEEPLVYDCNMNIMLKNAVSWVVTPEKSADFIFKAEEKTDRRKRYADTGRSGFQRTSGSEETGSEALQVAISRYAGRNNGTE
jgi:hypothetical protein